MSSRDLALTACFAALTAALGLIPAVPIPVLPVPVTAQTLGVMLAGGILGGRRGALAMAGVILVVAMGFPILAGGRGGLGVFAGPSAGFLLAWPLGAAVIGAIAHDTTSLPRLAVAVGLGGIGMVYLLGVPWMAVVANLEPTQALILGMSFLPGDAIKAVVAIWIIQHVRRSFPDL